MKYNIDRKANRIPTKVIVFLTILIVVFLTTVIISSRLYYSDLLPYSKNQIAKTVIIKPGYSVKQIANLLNKDHIIKSVWAFDIYVHTLNSSNLQAGTYNLSPSQSVQSIVKILLNGKIETKLITILPGNRIPQIRQDFINNGFSVNVVDNSLNPNLYNNIPIITDKPKSVNTLEGLLWPDSFLKDSNTTPETIIGESLQETSQHITPDIQAAFAKEKLTIYQGIILASIVNQEVSNPSDQAKAAQVFLSRLSLNMPLGSDVTANYGAVLAGVPLNLNYDSPYNTLIHTGLPPTPISTITQSALEAVAHPANTNWLYFVTGDNGVTYFSNTLAQQQQNTALYCHKLCQQP